MSISIRPEIDSDYNDIDNILERAFGGIQECRLVRSLRKQPDFIPSLSLVAVDEGDKPIGHILFSPIKLKGSDNYRTKLLALAPMAVLPEQQRQGIGIQLVESGLSKAKDLGFMGVVVLGHASYYPRFGFVPASILRLDCPWPVPDENWMVVELEENSLRGAQGMVIYPLPFYHLTD